jgi:hypothetical protein
MALWSNKKEFIFKAVEEMYTDVASRPDTVFHFPTAARPACSLAILPTGSMACRPRPLSHSRAWVIRSPRTLSGQAMQCSISGVAPVPTR